MTVYHLPKSNRYHTTEDCTVIQQASSDASEMTLSEAEQMNLDKCENCEVA